MKVTIGGGGQFETGTTSVWCVLEPYAIFWAPTFSTVYVIQRSSVPMLCMLRSAPNSHSFKCYVTIFCRSTRLSISNNLKLRTHSSFDFGASWFFLASHKPILYVWCKQSYLWATSMCFQPLQTGLATQAVFPIQPFLGSCNLIITGFATYSNHTNQVP